MGKMYYVYKVFLGKGFFYIRCFAESIEEANLKADEWCKKHRCSGRELVGREPD